MPELHFELCDLAGTPLAVLEPFGDGDHTVTIPYNAARTATLDVSLFDDEVLQVAPLSTVLKVAYGDALAIVGTVGRPVARGAAGTMTVPARDPVRRLERRMLRFGHVSVDDGFTRDGRGVRTLLADAEAGSAVQVADGDGILWTGIVPGDYPGCDTVPNSSDLTRAERGSQVWSTIEDLTRGLGSLDVEFVPVDAEHPPLSRAWEPGDLCELRTWEFQGEDRTDPTTTAFLSLDYGCGLANLEDFEAGPDAEALCNYAVAVAGGGERDDADAVHRQLAHSASWHDLGIYERWDAADVGEDLPDDELQATLRDRARFLVATYRDAPMELDLTLPPDRDDVPLWGRDYGVGDRVHVALKRGAWSWEGNAQVVEVTLRRDTSSGGTRQLVRVVPLVGGAAVDDSEGT